MNGNSSLRYEVVTLDNIELAYQIQHEVWPNEADYGSFWDKATHTREDNISWLVYVGDNLIGITGVYVEDIDINSIWLDWFAILPCYRKNGFGKQILLDTIDYCRKLGKYRYFRLDTTYYKNRPCLFLYNKVMDVREDYTAEDTDTCKYHYLIYSYDLSGRGMVELWDNKYLGLND